MTVGWREMPKALFLHKVEDEKTPEFSKSNTVFQLSFATLLDIFKHTAS